LEDNVVIRDKGGPLNLMGNIPVDAEEIEEIMMNAVQS
jgi:Xaa-Pro aminopeptidase